MLREKLAFKASTLSFMKSKPRKRSQNQTSNLAAKIQRLCLAKIKMMPPIAIIGNAKADIEKSPKPSCATMMEDTVVPILAPIIMPIAFVSCSTPAPTNHSKIRETRLLLWRRAVARVPVMIDLKAL